MKIDFQQTYNYNKTYKQINITPDELRNKFKKNIKLSSNLIKILLRK